MFQYLTPARNSDFLPSFFCIDRTPRSCWSIHLWLWFRYDTSFNLNMFLFRSAGSCNCHHGFCNEGFYLCENFEIPACYDVYCDPSILPLRILAWVPNFPHLGASTRLVVNKICYLYELIAHRRFLQDSVHVLWWSVHLGLSPNHIWALYTSRYPVHPRLA